jgi:hypothetical protein
VFDTQIQLELNQTNGRTKENELTRAERTRYKEQRGTRLEANADTTGL